MKQLTITRHESKSYSYVYDMTEDLIDSLYSHFVEFGTIDEDEVSKEEFIKMIEDGEIDSAEFDGFIGLYDEKRLDVDTSDDVDVEYSIEDES